MAMGESRPLCWEVRPDPEPWLEPELDELLPEEPEPAAAWLPLPLFVRLPWVPKPVPLEKESVLRAGPS